MSLNISNTMTLSKHHWLYILRSKDNYYYIGKTTRNNPYTRITEHLQGNGSKWTKIHHTDEVVSIESLGVISEQEAKDLENIKTLSLMKKYGNDKVRGGYMCFTGNYTELPNGYQLRNYHSLRSSSTIVFA